MASPPIWPPNGTPTQGDGAHEDAGQTTGGRSRGRGTGDAQAGRDNGGTTPATVTLKLPAAEVARAGLVLIGLGVGLYFVWSIHEVLFLLFLGILLATAIEPIVNLLRRGPFGRGSGVLVVYSTIVVATGLPTLIFGPGLVSQAEAFADGIPAKAASLRPFAEQLRPRALQEVAVGAIDRVGEAVTSPVPAEPESVVEIGTVAGKSVLHFVTVFFLAFYWLVERARIKRVLLRMVPPARAKDVNAVWLEVEQKLGGWVRGQLILMAAIAVMAGTGYFIMGLPNPFLLAVLAGLGELIPMIGPILAFTPAVIVALTIDPYTALIVVVYAIVIQQIESNILVPRVMGHTVGVSPLTVVLGILIGSILYGLPGAFLAVPVAGAVQVILAHVLRMEDPSQAEAHVPPQRATAQAESPPLEPNRPPPSTPPGTPTLAVVEARQGEA